MVNFSIINGVYRGGLIWGEAGHWKNYILHWGLFETMNLFDHNKWSVSIKLSNRYLIYLISHTYSLTVKIQVFQSFSRTTLQHTRGLMKILRYCYPVLTIGPKPHESFFEGRGLVVKIKLYMGVDSRGSCVTWYSLLQERMIINFLICLRSVINLLTWNIS